jgi:hypothetical protein
MRQAAGASALACGAGSGAGAAAGATAMARFAMLFANSAKSARATCTPPALAKVSKGPVTVKLPLTVSLVLFPSAAASTSPFASARDAPR